MANKSIKFEELKRIEAKNNSQIPNNDAEFFRLYNKHGRQFRVDYFSNNDTEELKKVNRERKKKGFAPIKYKEYFWWK